MSQQQSVVGILKQLLLLQEPFLILYATHIAISVIIAEQTHWAQCQRKILKLVKTTIFIIFLFYQYEKLCINVHFSHIINNVQVIKVIKHVIRFPKQFIYYSGLFQRNKYQQHQGRIITPFIYEKVIYVLVKLIKSCQTQNIVMSFLFIELLIHLLIPTTSLFSWFAIYIIQFLFINVLVIGSVVIHSYQHKQSNTQIILLNISQILSVMNPIWARIYTEDQGFYFINFYCKIIWFDLEYNSSKPIITCT
ncbi:hypothetical protein pb186bvf_019083 [Paramecium bursaria]